MQQQVSNPTPIGNQPAKTVFLETFGCQMNELDSELVRGHLRALGYRFIDDAAQADVVLYNTCSVREQAENKVWSRIGIQGLRKKEGASFILGVIGCMAERDGTDMIRRFPQVDLMCGPGELDKLPMLIENAFKTDAAEAAEKRGADPNFAGRVALQGNNSRRASTLEAVNDNLELLDLSRAFDPDFSSSRAAGKSAYVRITRGCNKFCTYCVVPYTRGAEVHRPPDSIIEECKKLADQGVIEITLLGQTVNHYIYTHGTAVSANGIELPQVGPGANAFAAKPRHGNASALTRTTTFADLLKRIHDEVPAIQRLRFVTSFPRDFGDDILHVMAESPRICKYLHVPAQSGSNRILKLMNRGYTAEEYLEFIQRAREILAPSATSEGVCIAGDFIVGFPTETEEDFEQTKDLLRRVRFKNNFIFKYSPRPGTVAINRFADDVPEPVKRRRNNELLALQTEISAAVHAEFVGKTVNVFVEQITKRSATTGQSHGHNLTPRDQATLAVSRQMNGTGVKAAGAMLTISAKSNSAASAAAESGGGGESAAGQVYQMSGRTQGDLITVFDVVSGVRADNPGHEIFGVDLPGGPDDLIGRIVPVQITGSAPLLLRGRLV